MGCLTKFGFIFKKIKKESDCKAVLYAFAHAYSYVHKLTTLQNYV